MSFRVLFTPEASRNLTSILSWLSEQSPQGVSRWYDEFWRTIRRLESNPEQFGSADEAQGLGLDIRQALFHTRRGRTYRLVVRVRSNTVQVIAVRCPGQAPLAPDALYVAQ